MKFHIVYWDARGDRCATYDSVTSIDEARSLWSNILYFEPEAHNPKLLSRFDGSEIAANLLPGLRVDALKAINVE